MGLRRAYAAGSIAISIGLRGRLRAPSYGMASLSFTRFTMVRVSVVFAYAEACAAITGVRGVCLRGGLRDN